MSVIGVVLAAGRGARLTPHVPAYHKPLLTVNGRTIVAQAVENLVNNVPDIDEIVVVVSPSNAHQIVQVTTHITPNIQYVIQPEAGGPGDALSRALHRAAPHDEVIVVMGDNVLGEHDVENVFTEHRGGGITVGISSMPVESAVRFARLDGSARWVEGPRSVAEEDMVQAATHQTVWLGPIRLLAGAWFDHRDKCRVGDEVKIAPLFRHEPVTIVACNSYDVGDPGAV